MLTARYNVRRGELDAAGNEFIGAIDAQKNELTLEESRRRLKQLEDDAGGARGDDRAAALAVVQERRNKAQMAMERAQGIIDNLEVKAPTDGVVSVKENRDGQFFFFTGMVLPQYREGDSTFSGRNIADIVESGKMEVRAKVTETDRDNLQAGQPATVQVDALPGRTFTAKVGAAQRRRLARQLLRDQRGAPVRHQPASSRSPIRRCAPARRCASSSTAASSRTRCTCRGRRCSRRTARTTSSCRSATASIAATSRSRTAPRAAR